MPSRAVVSKWIDKSVGKSYDTDKKYGAQCYDLINAYTDFTKNPRIPGQYAKQIFDNANPKYYQKIKNTVTFVPKCGDIMVWGAWNGNPFGHTAVVQGANVAYFKSLDQNWYNASIKGSPARKVRHSYTSPRVIGVVRPKNVK